MHAYDLRIHHQTENKSHERKWEESGAKLLAPKMIESVPSSVFQYQWKWKAVVQVSITTEKDNNGPKRPAFSHTLHCPLDKV